MSVVEDVWSLFDTFHVDDEGNQGDEDNASASVSAGMDLSYCSYCKDTTVILEEGNYICKKCNSVVMRYIDSNAEWRFYGAEDNRQVDPTRCGLPVNNLLPNSSLGSIISSKSGESFGMKMVRKHHFWNSISYKERCLYHVFDNISTSSGNHGLSPCIIEEAKVLYKQMAENKVTRGENKNGMIATSIYMSCKKHNVPRSSKEIAKIFNIKNTTMTKGCKRFQDVLRLNTDSCIPEDFINRFGSKINIAQDIRDMGRNIMKKVNELGILSENTPPSVAAGVLLLVITICDLNISKKDLSDACGISQVTICKCYKKLHNYRAKILNTDIILKYGVK